MEGRRTLVPGPGQPLLRYKEDGSNKPGDPCQPGAYLEVCYVTRGLEVLLGIRPAEPAKLGQLKQKRRFHLRRESGKSLSSVFPTLFPGDCVYHPEGLAQKPSATRGGTTPNS